MITLDSHPSAPKVVIWIALPSTRWEGSSFDTATEMGASWEAPLRDLAAACEAANTRYGYIQTDKELAVCIFCLKGENWTTEFMSIPMSIREPDALTADLALWWLCMLGLSKQGFELTTPEETAPIDQWIHTRDDDSGGWWWQNVYSLREDLA